MCPVSTNVDTTHMPMNTSAILRHVMSELRAAHDEAVYEYGRGSQQADAIADALLWMSDWLNAYTRVTTARQRG